jgi:hypothetical protein
MRYSNRYQTGRDQVKVAVLADQMRADESNTLSVSDLLLGGTAIALAFNLLMILH